MRIILAISLLLGLTSASLAQGICWHGGPGQNTNPITVPYNYYQGQDRTPFWAALNPWAVPDGTVYSETITVNPSTFPAGTTMAWNFPSQPGPASVYSYPEVIWGVFFGGCAPSPNGVNPTPAQVKNIQEFTGTADVSIGGNTDQGFNVLWEGFLTDGPDTGKPGAGGGILLEIGIHLHSVQGRREWALSFPHYTFTDGDFSAEIAGPIDIGIPHLVIGIFPTSVSQEWLIRFVEHRIGDRRIIRLIRKWLKAGNGDRLSGTVNILKILQSLQDHGIITGDEYLGGWELGAETVLENGTLTVNHLSYTWSVK